MRLIRAVTGRSGSLSIYDDPERDAYVRVVSSCRRRGGRLVRVERYPRTPTDLLGLQRYLDEIQAKIDDRHARLEELARDARREAQEEAAREGLEQVEHMMRDACRKASTSPPAGRVLGPMHARARVPEPAA